jgi:hypothetical protein
MRKNFSKRDKNCKYGLSAFCRGLPYGRLTASRGARQALLDKSTIMQGFALWSPDGESGARQALLDKSTFL